MALPDSCRIGERYCDWRRKHVTNDRNVLADDSPCISRVRSLRPTALPPQKYTLTDRDTALRYRDTGQEGRESYLVNRNIANQFELPVLFHPVCLLLYITDADNIVTVVLAWLFVISRYAHSFVHVTSNRLRYRAPLFAIGFALLVCLWGWLAIWLALE